MHKTIIGALAWVLAAGIHVPVATAHTGSEDANNCPEPHTMVIGTPTANSTVGRNFTLSGEINPPFESDLTVVVTIDGNLYVDPSSRTGDNSEFLEFITIPAGQQRFSVNLDLNGNQVMEGSGISSAQRQGVAEGVHSLWIGPYEGPYGECPSLITADDVAVLVRNAQPARVTGENIRPTQKPKPSAIPSPSLSPTPRPIDEAPAVAGSFFDRMEPHWWALVGLLLGGLLLGGAEAISRKHRARGRK